MFVIVHVINKKHKCFHTEQYMARDCKRLPWELHKQNKSNLSSQHYVTIRLDLILILSCGFANLYYHYLLQPIGNFLNNNPR